MNNYHFVEHNTPKDTPLRLVICGGDEEFTTLPIFDDFNFSYKTLMDGEPSSSSFSPYHQDIVGNSQLTQPPWGMQPM
jgi:hypothetical protein